jgi:hypothetical protein
VANDGRSYHGHLYRNCSGENVLVIHAKASADSYAQLMRSQ